MSVGDGGDIELGTIGGVEVLAALLIVVAMIVAFCEATG